MNYLLSSLLELILNLWLWQNHTTLQLFKKNLLDKFTTINNGSNKEKTYLVPDKVGTVELTKTEILKIAYLANKQIFVSYPSL